MKKKLLVSDIIKTLGGSLELASLEDKAFSVYRISSLQSGKIGDIASLIHKDYIKQAQNSKVSLIITNSIFRSHIPQHNCIVTANPHLYFARLSALWFQEHKTLPLYPVGNPSTCIHKSAKIGKNCILSHGVVIEENAVIGDEVYLGPHVLIMKNSHIGHRSILYGNTVIYSHCIIGERCIIHASAIIGSDGFGFTPNEKMTAWVKIPQLSGVIIGDDCEIGANTTIDCGTFDPTYLGNGVKLDNQIQVGHNVSIGDHTVIAAQVGIAGCTKIGQFCRIGGKAGFNQNITIGDYATITPSSIVMKDIPSYAIYSSGWPALPTKQWFRLVATLKKISKISSR